MAQLQVQHDDLIATLEAQRNEAWSAAAMAGAAVRAATRRIEALEKELAETGALVGKNGGVEAAQEAAAA